MALTILAIGLLGVASMHLSALHNNTMGNLMTQATLLAQKKMEELKNTADVTSLSDGTESGIDLAGVSGGKFDRAWAVTNPLGGNATRQIQVTVQWSHGAVNRQVVLASFTQGQGI